MKNSYLEFQISHKSVAFSAAGCYASEK